MNICVTKIQTLNGRVMMTRADVAKELGISTGTVDARCKDMEKEIELGRYDEKVLTKVGGIKIINFLAFLDYLHYKPRLDEKSLRKNVPAYDPVSWSKQLGYYKEVEAL